METYWIALRIVRRLLWLFLLGSLFIFLLQVSPHERQRVPREWLNLAIGFSFIAAVVAGIFEYRARKGAGIPPQPKFGTGIHREDQD